MNKAPLTILAMVLLLTTAFLATLATSPALANKAEVSGDAKLVRFICQNYDRFRKHYLDYVMILDQLSVAAVDPEANFGFDTVDGTVLLDANHPRWITGEVKFRLRIYQADLMSVGTSREEVDGIVDELASRRADRDPKNRIMDYTGTGLRIGADFDFESTGPYHFTKDISIVDIDDADRRIEARLGTNLGAGHIAGDGFYRCLKPLLLPAS